MLKFVEVEGFKSISSRQRVRISGLTVLAGANSSGKSSMLQPLLLLKQTLESPFDPGPLLLDGANVRLTSTSQIISKARRSAGARDVSSSSFAVSLGFDAESFEVSYRRTKSGAMKIERQRVSTISGRNAGAEFEMREGIELVKDALDRLEDPFPKVFLKAMPDAGEWAPIPVRDRCFLKIRLVQKTDSGVRQSGIEMAVGSEAIEFLKSFIHLPGLRGNPERTYRATQVANSFPGTFENYVASIVLGWQEDQDARLSALGEQLRLLGLTWKVKATRQEDTRVELKVGRLPRPGRGGAHDVVSIADVGLGVSQVLPILVALLAARRGQVVHIEQPELHLHPKAQWRLAEIFRDAVNRGVRVIVETHSSIFIRGIQTEVARRHMKAESVVLNWFVRAPDDGATSVSEAVLDGHGAFGDWPGDFDDTMLEAEGSYLDAVDSLNSTLVRDK